jgi:hypothetical protein
MGRELLIGHVLRERATGARWVVMQMHRADFEAVLVLTVCQDARRRVSFRTIRRDYVRVP